MSSLAKDDVDNVGAGRAAKGENPVASTKNTVQPHGYTVFFCLRWRVKAKPRITVGSSDEHPKIPLYFFPYPVGARKLCPWAETRRLDQKMQEIV